MKLTKTVGGEITSFHPAHNIEEIHLKTKVKGTFDLNKGGWITPSGKYYSVSEGVTIHDKINKRNFIACPSTEITIERNNKFNNLKEFGLLLLFVSIGILIAMIIASV